MDYDTGPTWIWIFIFVHAMIGFLTSCFAVAWAIGWVVTHIRFIGVG